MTNRIVIKRSGVANTAPVAGDLEHGELAINYADGLLYYKDSGNAVQIIANAAESTAGPTGPTGPLGPSGATGPTGTTGPTGPVTPYIFDGGDPSSTYFVGPAFDCGGVT